MKSDCDTGGGIGILCVGKSNPIILNCTFEWLINSIALLNLSNEINDTLFHPAPLISSTNILNTVFGFYDFFCFNDIAIYNGGFVDNCYLGVTEAIADTTLGIPIDTVGDGICTTTSTFWKMRFKDVDGVVNPRGDTLLTGVNKNEIDILPTTSNYLILNNNYPNPFSEYTTIEFIVNNNSSIIDLLIYDSKGNSLKNLINRKSYPIGKHSINWYGDIDNGQMVSKGVYFYKLTSGNILKVKKAIVKK